MNKRGERLRSEYYRIIQLPEETKLDRDNKVHSAIDWFREVLRRSDRGIMGYEEYPEGKKHHYKISKIISKLKNS